MISTFNINIVHAHKQLHTYSCIPSAIELVLKLTGKVDADFYDLQHNWQNRVDGSFASFNGQKLHGLKLSHRFNRQRDDSFPLEKLFDLISQELHEQRYVIVSLPSPGGWHMSVIYDEQDKEFFAFTKIGQGKSSKTQEFRKIRTNISEMKGTDILIYKDLHEINSEV